MECKVWCNVVWQSLADSSNLSIWQMRQSFGDVWCVQSCSVSTGTPFWATFQDDVKEAVDAIENYAPLQTTPAATNSSFIHVDTSY